MMLMWIFFLGALALTEAGLWPIIQTQQADRVGKSLAEFAYFIGCHTGRFPLNYNGHGRYCGRTPEGVHGPPQDPLDRCCQVHDACYGRAVNSGACYGFSPYIRPYFISFTECRCVVRHSLRGRLNQACGNWLCRCDYEAAVCFSRANPPGSSARCVDYNRQCFHWASIGECRRNPRYMHVHCKKSCRMC